MTSQPDETGKRWLPFVSVFSISLVLCGAIAVCGVISPEGLSGAAQALTTFSLTGFDWLFLTSCTAFLILALVLAISRYGNVKLGAPGDEPEFSTVSWLAMLFAAGMGAGLLFWAVAEPVHHFMRPPPGQTAGSSEAARTSMVITNFHWGLHAWGIYALGALVLAYFGFTQGKPLLASSPIKTMVGGRTGTVLGNIADIVAVVAVVFGVAGSLGMGVMQIGAGLNEAFGWSTENTAASLGLLAVLTICYMISASTSLDKGIQLLSNINMGLAVFLMLFILFVGPTTFLLATFVNSVGDYFDRVLLLSTRLFHYSGETEWSRTWTLTYLIWWIAWTPFVGIFVARISKGRTIRQFVIGVIFLPTMFSLLWFAVFGGTGLYIELFGGGGIGSLVTEDVTKALFGLFDYFPASQFLSVIALLLVFIFLITSADSASFVLGMMTSHGSLEPPPWRKLLWGIIVALLTGSTLLSGGGVHVMRAIAISGAIPFILIMILNAFCLLRSLAELPAEAVSKQQAADRGDSGVPEMAGRAS